MNKKIKMFFIFSLIIFLSGVIYIYLNWPSDYFKKLIENGELKPLALLETTAKDKYDAIIQYLPKNEKVKNYYYEIEISINYDEKTIKNMTPEEYSVYKELPEYNDLEIERIEYAIWYYKAFSKIYDGWAGDPTGKCFSVIYNKGGDFIGKYLWK